jgi:hypothetical protein
MDRNSSIAFDKIRGFKGYWLSKLYNIEGKISISYNKTDTHLYGICEFVYGHTKPKIIPVSGRYDYDDSEKDMYRLVLRNSSVNARDTQYIFTIIIMNDNKVGLSYYSSIYPGDHGEMYVDPLFI